jgi:glycosyltransferase involved in cell wall biosynthesis
VSTVQVIIPCYNYGHYLRACVASALSQEGVDVSVLIIDDCSSDNSVEISRELAAADRRVSFIHHSVNKGHIATYNEGLALAISDYLVLLSADDLLTPGALRRAADLMDRHPSVGLVYGHPLTFQDDAPSAIRTKVSGWTIWNGAKWVEMMCRTGRNFIMCPEVVMRTRIQHRIGGYTPELPHSGDMEMWLRAAAVSDVGRVRGTDQACYRTHPLSMQRTIHAGLLFDLKGRFKAFEAAFSKEAGQLPKAEWLFTEAKRALSRTAIRQAVQSIKCNEKLEQPLEAYEQFAFALDPDLVTTKEWRIFEQVRRRPRGRLSVLLARQIVDVRNRVVWRRWRHSGIYQNVQ